MIKKTFLLGFAVAMLFASCKKEAVDDTTAIGKLPATIYGNWTYLKDSTVNVQGSNVISTQVDTSNAGRFVMFNNDNTGEDLNATFTYKITLDNRLQIFYPARTENGVKIAASSIDAKLLELSDHKLYYAYTNYFTFYNRYVTLTR